MRKPRLWSNYRDNQKQYECDLVSCLNAYYCLTGEAPYKDAAEYEKLLVEYRRDSTECEDRPAISKLYKKLGMRVIRKVSLFDIRSVDVSFPVILVIRDGFSRTDMLHSVCVVEYNKKVDALRVANFSWRTNSLGWILREELLKYLPYWPNCNCDKTFYENVGTRSRILTGNSYGLVIGLKKLI